MPSSAVRTFTDPVEFFTGIRNLQIVGIVQRRGEFRARSTRIDLHRLFLCRFDENLPRLMKVSPSGGRAGILFAVKPGQPAMLVNGTEIAEDQIARVGLHWEWYLRSSAPSEWGTMSLAAEDSRCGRGDYRARIGAPELRSQHHAAGARANAVAEITR